MTMIPSSKGEGRKDISVHQTEKNEEETRRVVLDQGNSCHSGRREQGTKP